MALIKLLTKLYSQIVKFMKTKNILRTTLLFSCFFIVAAFAKDDVIEINIIKSNSEIVEASIKNLSESAKKMNIDKMSIIGRKNQNNRVTEVNWEKLTLNGKEVELPSSFRSKVVMRSGIEEGDTFKAKGDYGSLTSAIEQLLTPDISQQNHLDNKIKPLLPQDQTNDTFATSGNNSSKLSTLSNSQKTASDITSEIAVDDTVTTVNCAPRVDYQLNKVFMQERTLTGGTETQGCKDTNTSYDLLKDYDSCPNTTDISARKIIYNFQYFFVDSKDSKSAVDSCQEDKSKTKALDIITSYKGCSDSVDLASRIVYSQYKQSYKDSDDKDILIQDCTIDRNKSYVITESYTGCGIRDLFDLGYSISQSKFSYTKDGSQILVQDCQDTTKKYQHVTTTDTCSPVVDSDQITIFNRKYITVDGIKQYITECSPVSSNVSIQSENCTSTPFTHDLVAGQSFQNKNYFYTDLDGNRVEVSSCVKSEISYAQQEDTSVCTAENDDVNMKTYLYSRKYITVNAAKKYITDCAKVTTSIPYKEIGYKWSQEYNLSSASITVSNSGDNEYLGSAQGTVVWHQESCQSAFENLFSINGYSGVNKCKNYSSPSYNGNSIDLAYSNKSTITYDNYVENRSSSPLCRIRYSYMNTNTHTCSGGPSTICNSSNNTLYYQHCNSYKCPVYKLVKKPIMQRNDGSRIINDSRTLGSKYTCGNNSLNGVEVIY